VAHEGHNTDSIDGIINVGPAVLATLGKTKSEQNAVIDSVINAIRNSRRLVQFGEIYRDLIVDLIHGKELKAALVDCGNSMGTNIEMSAKRGDPMTA
jgi:hypothetical protein